VVRGGSCGRIDATGRLAMFVCCGSFRGLEVAGLLGVLIFLGRFRDDVKEFAPTTPGHTGGGARNVSNAFLKIVVPVGLAISG